MAPFNLKIITSEGIHFEGEAESVTVRSVVGDVTILANHTDYVTALGIGKATVSINGTKRFAACSQGVLTVIKGEVTLLATTFEWQDDIDESRAQASLEREKAKVANLSDDKSIKLAQIKIQRALTRLDVKKM